MKQSAKTNAGFAETFRTKEISMKKVMILLLAMAFSLAAFAQDTKSETKKETKAPEKRKSRPIPRSFWPRWAALKKI